MLLLLDVGNTQTVIGLYQGDQLVHQWRIRSDREKSSDEYSVLFTQLLAQKKLEPASITGVAIACVVPPVLPTFVRMIHDTFGLRPVVLSAADDPGLVIHYEHPRDVGADRIANALAVKAKYPLPAIVVDFGTATTFDCISEKGEYLGGVICPGVEISMEALFARASKLPRISLEHPGTAIGTNTTMSMQAGILYGTAGEVDAIIKAIKHEMGGQPTVIATGGLSAAIGPHCQSVDVIDEHLTLEGLRLYFLRKTTQQPGNPGD